MCPGLRGVLNNMVVEKHVAEDQNDLGGNGGERVEQDGSRKIAGRGASG